MRAERFGSYSIVETLAGMSRLSRLKSMMRYIRLCPPPRHHDVSSPWLLRPPVRWFGSTSGLCGSLVVISSKVWTVWKRWPGDVGLNLRIGIKTLLCAFEELRHFFAFAQLHVGLLPVRAAAGKAPLSLHLAVRDARPDAVHLGAEQLLDGPLDLHLVRARRDLKHDRPAVFAQDRRLLGDERAPDDVGDLDAHASASWSFSNAPFVATTVPASATWRAVRRPLCT